MPRLLRAAREAEKASSKQHDAIVHAIRDDHIRSARLSIRSADILDTLTEQIRDECDDLSVFLEATQVRGTPNPLREDAG